MPFGFHQKCRFCYEQKLTKSEPVAFDWLGKLCCLGKFYCPHCFDVFVRPTLPGIAAILFWACTYTATYFVVADPVHLVTYQWPDNRAAINQQVIFAPLIKLDPRIREAKLDLDVYEQAIRESIAEKPGTTVIR